MRRRLVRELGTAAGIIVILLAVAGVNMELRRSGLAERMVAWREAAERQQAEMGGLDLVSWRLLQRTSGSRRTGPSFSDELLPYDGAVVDIIGFMAPLDAFRQVKSFLLLPMPIECYFCESPPMREIVLVTMNPDTVTDLYQEPVYVHGKLTLNQGPGAQFFYRIDDAELAPGMPEGQLRRKDIPLDHRIHLREAAREEQLYEGIEPPTAGD